MPLVSQHGNQTLTDKPLRCILTPYATLYLQLTYEIIILYNHQNEIIILPQSLHFKIRWQLGNFGRDLGTIVAVYYQTFEWWRHSALSRVCMIMQSHIACVTYCMCGILHAWHIVCIAYCIYDALHTWHIAWVGVTYAYCTCGILHTWHIAWVRGISGGVATK